MASWYKKSGDSYIVNMKEGQEVRYFIPERWFDAGIAIVNGDYINLLGVFCYALYDANGKPIGKLKNFNWSMSFLCQPYKVDRMKDIKLTQYDDPIDYRVLRFKNGDKLIIEDKVPQMVENVEAMFKMFVISGHVSSNIDYRKLDDYFLENVEYSGNHYDGVPIQMMGIFVSEMCRDINDPSKPFRLSTEKKKGIFTGYKSVSVRDIPKYKSPFQSFVSENMDESLISAIMSDKTNETPLERVLMGTPKEAPGKAKQ